MGEHATVPPHAERLADGSFCGLFALGAMSVGWWADVPHMLAAVLGATLTELAINRFDRRPLACLP